MSIFSYNFVDRRKNDLSSFSENFSKRGYAWEDVKKQITGSVPEVRKEPQKAEPKHEEIARDNSWGFFNNPRSEWEDKRKSMVEDYRKEMQAKFQEKIEKDKKPKYMEKREFYSSMKQTEEPKQNLLYNRSVVMNQSLDVSQSEQPSYYSPQYRSKFDSNPYSYQSPVINPQYSNTVPQNPIANPQPYSNPRQYIKEKSPEPRYEYSKTNLTSDQNKGIREKQLEEWKKTVQAQLEERNKAKEEQKSRKLLEDKLEEAKIKRDLDELNKKYQQEIRYETGAADEKYEPVQVYRPPPQFEEREAMPMRTSVIRQPVKVKDDFKTKHDLVLQEAGIRDIILKIRSEANHAAAERQEILIELDKMKSELRNTRLYDPFGASSAYYRPYKSPENKFLTFSSAGKSIVNNSWKQNEELNSKSKYIVKKNNVYYNEIDSPEVKHQLSQLDSILTSQIEEKSGEDDGEKKIGQLESEFLQKNEEKIEESETFFKTEVNEEIVENNEKIENNEEIVKNNEEVENPDE